MTQNRSTIPTFLIVLALVVVPASAASVHEKIDDLLVAQNPKQAFAPISSDSEFLRRIFLDLNGTIPSAAEVRTFLEDKDPQKRAKLIDALLARPEYPRRMQEAFGVMLMERRGGGGGDKWNEYLQASFAANKPWDQLCREMLNPDAAQESTKGAAMFLSKRLESYGANLVDYPGLARDVGRMFLGVDLRCAQCHNHKYIKDYKQADFQGLFAFVGNAYNRPEGGVGEKPLFKKIEYVSVFQPDNKKETGPRVYKMDEMGVPEMKAGEEWAQKPDPKKKIAGVLKFSPLKLMSEQLPRSDVAAFKRNGVNRIWWLMMGRGLIHPLDLDHSENPPSHPALFDYLAEEFATSKFNMKGMIREIALSQAYQRSSELPAGIADAGPASYCISVAKRMSAEQLMWSVLGATGRIESATPTPTGDSKPVELASADDEKKIDSLDDAEKAVKAAEAAKLAATQPVDAAKAAKVAIADLRNKFVRAFASPEGEPETDYAPTVAEALFVSNDKRILERLQPQPGNLIDRLSKITDSSALAEEMYLTILTRKPADDERQELTAYLAKRTDDRAKAIGEYAWAMLASTEFSINH